MSEETAIEEIDGEVVGDGRVPLPGSGGDLLRMFIARDERLSEEAAAIAADRRELRAEVKAAGFDLVAYREVLRRRRMTPSQRHELDCLTEVYESAIGDVPIGAIDGGQLSAAPRLAGPVGKKLAEADAWADGLGR